MNAVIAPRQQAAPRPAHARIALLGTGTVGSAVLARIDGWKGTPFGERLTLAHVANSRFAFSPSPGTSGWCEVPEKAAALTDVARTLGAQGTRIVIDATANDAVAEYHAHWLSQGIHVVTASKLGQGASLARWRAIRDAQRIGDSRYGDSATVGAGLPLLRSIRALQAGGDRIHAIAGVLSGSLAWLFDRYDGVRPFSDFVREAREAGYTEPDPREDLNGEDVRRKLLILARAAGVALEPHQIEVASLVSASLAVLPLADIDAALPRLDEAVRAHHATACRQGETLRFIARLENGKARVGLESLPADHPLAGGSGTDNRIAISSDRYCRQPLVIQGPGAGAGVTAAAVLDDVLEIVAGR